MQVVIKREDTLEVEVPDSPQEVMYIRILGDGRIMVNAWDERGEEVTGQISVKEILENHSTDF